MGNLILVRHGESLWNKKGIWTGLTDISLSQKGIDEARLAGEKLKGIPIDFAHTSVLIRAKQTLAEIKKVLELSNIVTFESSALNERDYGIYTGKNKWQIEKEIGREKFEKIRRGWNFPIPKGETLEDVYNRVIPYYKSEILPMLKLGKNILIVAHGNSLRSLVKYLENISDKDISLLELKTGQVYLYKIDNYGNLISSEQVKYGEVLLDEG